MLTFLNYHSHITHLFVIIIIMKRKYIKLNDNYNHLSLGNIIGAIKDASKNKTSAIQSEVFCAIFNITYINDSTVNNYCIGSRSIGNDYKQIYINLKKQYLKDKNITINIVCNILSIIEGTIFDIKNIKIINNNESLKTICQKLYNISKNDFYVPKNTISEFRDLYQNNDYYNLFMQMLFFAILDKKQPLYEDERNNNIIETLLDNTDISINDLQNFLLLELNEGINFSHSLKRLADNGNSYANYHLAVMEYRGEYTGESRYDKAFDYFLKAAANKHPSAYWMLGNMIINEKIAKATKKDLKMAFDYFTKAKELGNIAAINSLGLCYYNGLGVEKNIDKALKLFQEASFKNYAYAYNNLGLFYEQKKDYKLAFNYFLKSANLGESYACNKIGEYYRLRGNYKDAFIYYNKALESNYREITPWAYYNLAKYFYLNGNNVTNTLKDIDKAILYFNKSNILIESLIELLFIYYEKYLIDYRYLEKLNYYKKLIESHPKYNEKIKELIELDLKTKAEINLN